MQKFRTVELSDPGFERDGLRHITVKSASLKRRGDITFFIPEQLRDNAATTMLILLNGVWNSHWGWAYLAGVHLTAQRLIDTGEIAPLVIAMPSDGLWGDGSGYLNVGGENAETWIMEDVVAAASLVIPGLTPQPRLFLGGQSMGGYGALRLGAKYAAQISGISAHSSITHISQMANFVEEPLSHYLSAASLEELDPLYWILRNRKILPELRIDCGTEDTLLSANRHLHNALDDAAIDHQYFEYEGGHEWPYWAAHISDSLRFFQTVRKAQGF
jgi:enterochelin esterase-like enzyme